jgi:hypothetical protein
MAVAAIMFYRVALILDASRFYFGPFSGWAGLGHSESRFALLELGLAISLFVGFLTPVCIALIVISYHRFDLALGTHTLGTHVLLQLLVVLLITGAGSSLSLDSILMRRSSSRSRRGLVCRLYRFLGDPNGAEVRVYLFIGLVAYWVISFAALLNHAADAYWRSGDTVRVMLQSSYISRFAGPARSLERAYPQIMSGFSQIAVLGEAVFQVGMILLIRWKWGYRFILWWGVAFFALSTLALQLSYLPLLEVCLWVLIFGRTRKRTTSEEDGLEGRDSLPDSSALPQNVSAGFPAPWRRRSAQASAALVISLLTVCGIAIMCFPQTEREVDSVFGVDLARVISPIQPRLNNFLAAAGLSPPNVFNSIDLQMGDNWPVIYRVESDGSKALVPLSATDGHRLWYHWSDLIYYGSSVPWRRAMIGADLAAQHQRGMPGYQSIEKILLYDYRRQSESAPVAYQINLFRSDASRVELSADVRFTGKLTYTYTETVVELLEAS